MWFFFSTSVEIFWIGFEDPQSGMSHYEVCIGTKPYDCDVVPKISYLISTKHIINGLSLPQNRNMYATVTGYNRVNKSISVSSSHFKVDISPPQLLIKPNFLTNYSSRHNIAIQWERSVLKINWKFVDFESPIVRQIVNLNTHHEGHTPIEHMELGNQNELTINLDSHNWLQNGDTYQAIITSCNAADLCTTAESDDLLVDSTPPYLGGFKYPLTWQNYVDDNENVVSSVNLSWYGFYDQESGIRCFYVGVGKSFTGNELSNGLVEVTSDNNMLTEYNASFTLNEPLFGDEKIVISIMAENEAGLLSPLARLTVVSLTTTPLSNIKNSTGIFEIEKHSCDIHFCDKVCTCAVVDKPCTDVDTNLSCYDFTGNSENLHNISLLVYGGTVNAPTNITTSSSCLSAHWYVVSGGLNIKRYEWSIGVKGMPYGEGVFDLMQENPWVDNEKIDSFVHCLPFNRSLIHGTEYVIYVKAWVDIDTYLIFKSWPVMIDHTPPAIRTGRYLKDSDKNGVRDFDIIYWKDNMTAVWSGVFQEPQGHIIYYTIGLGTMPGGNIVSFFIFHLHL